MWGVCVVHLKGTICKKGLEEWHCLTLIMAKDQGGKVSTKKFSYMVGGEVLAEF